MSEPIPESIPTSQDPRSKRPTKRRALTPSTEQASHLTALFAKPDRDIPIPTSATRPPRTTLPAPPEIVANVQGSSAGAGSGEFHVYKASRRREYERVKLMDEQLAREKADAEFEARRAEMRRREEERTGRNRRRRERLKKGKGKGNGKGEGGVAANVEMEGEREGEEVVRGGEDDVGTGRERERVEVNGREAAARVEEDPGLVIYDDE
ncbi:MAG: hypothetical protein LQ342_001811 [Letrouitia transgressa]|nr:MAG: hypothetical protein LQ342_001811 [Letrouitia transgressa]